MLSYNAIHGIKFLGEFGSVHLLNILYEKIFTIKLNRGAYAYQQ